METQGTDDFDFLASGPASTSGRSDAELLKSALMNEKASPEVLAFETDLVGRIEQNMDYQVRRRWRRQARRPPPVAATAGQRQVPLPTPTLSAAPTSPPRRTSR